MPGKNKVVHATFAIPKVSPTLRFNEPVSTRVATKVPNITFDQLFPANMDPALKARVLQYLYNEYTSGSMYTPEIPYAARVLQDIDSTLKAQGNTGIADVVLRMNSTAQEEPTGYKIQGRRPAAVTQPMGSSFGYSIDRYGNTRTSNFGTYLLFHELWHALASRQPYYYNYENAMLDEPIATAAGQYIEGNAPTAPRRWEPGPVIMNGRNIYRSGEPVPPLYRNLDLLEARRRAYQNPTIGGEIMWR